MEQCLYIGRGVVWAGWSVKGGPPHSLNELTSYCQYGSDYEIKYFTQKIFFFSPFIARIVPFLFFFFVLWLTSLSMLIIKSWISFLNSIGVIWIWRKAVGKKSAENCPYYKFELWPVFFTLIFCTPSPHPRILPFERTRQNFFVLSWIP